VEVKRKRGLSLKVGGFAPKFATNKLSMSGRASIMLLARGKKGTQKQRGGERKTIVEAF